MTYIVLKQKKNKKQKNVFYQLLKKSTVLDESQKRFYRFYSGEKKRECEIFLILISKWNALIFSLIVHKFISYTSRRRMTRINYRDGPCSGSSDFFSFFSSVSLNIKIFTYIFRHRNDCIWVYYSLSQWVRFYFQKNRNENH